MSARASATRASLLLSSWWAFGLVLVVLVSLAVAAMVGVDAQDRHQRVRAAVSEAQLISQATAARDLGGDTVTNPLTPQELDDLSGDVTQLEDGGNLLGLSVFRLDGTAVFRDGTHVSAPAAMTSAQASAHTSVANVRSFSGGRSVAAVSVVLPIDVTRDGVPDLLVTVTIPAGDLASLSHAYSSELIAALVALLLAVAVGAFDLRRRTRRRNHLLLHDPLTGLGNRLLLERELHRRLVEARQCGVLLINIDAFRRVNDTLGRSAGDELLQTLGGAMQDAIRPGDVLARLSGDDFAVLLEGLDGEATGAAARRLLQVLERQYVVHGVTLDVEVSIGAAVSTPGETSGTEELMRTTDIAMQQAKRGKLGVQVYDVEYGQRQGRDLPLLLDLRAAIDGRELFLAYQPTAALQGDATPFVEALARWTHPVLGPIPPDRFVTLAESTALIHPLTLWVLDEAVRQCAAWHRDGLAVTVGVNLSPRSLTKPGLVEDIQGVLNEHGLPAWALHLEITETAIIAEPDQAREVLTRLSARGVKLSIDDFGAGYTSLAYLQTLPMDVLKIDRQFIQHLRDSPTAAAIVAGIIGLAHGLDMSVVAEGIEDLETLMTLTGLGCDVGQGFYLSRPVDADTAAAWIRYGSTAPVPGR
jgi:diguanylate cyclase (GGDEF)-like protein